jgi:hypothetical protein
MTEANSIRLEGAGVDIAALTRLPCSHINIAARVPMSSCTTACIRCRGVRTNGELNARPLPLASERRSKRGGCCWRPAKVDALAAATESAAVDERTRSATKKGSIFE